MGWNSIGFSLAAGFFVGATLVGVTNPNPPARGPENATVVAQALLRPSGPSKVSGTVEITTIQEGIMLRAAAAHLGPGPHAIYIHEKGDCSAPDASSTGGHFNPFHERHGAPHAAHHHLGDMGNLAADVNGNASLGLILRGMSAKEAEALVGKAIVIHEKSDEARLPIQGGRGLACGVIVKVDTILH